MHVLGMHTILIRDTDRSIYTDGDTIAAKKISDIKERLRIVNTTPNALLVSIHQNYFHDSRYSGMQVFYHSNDTSKKLASMIQEASKQLSPDNTRNIKRSTGVYLMEHINCTGVLVECGFLSNPVEEQLLRTDTYQQKVAAVIAVSVNQYLNT